MVVRRGHLHHVGTDDVQVGEAAQQAQQLDKLLEAGAIRISAIKSGGLSRNRLAIGVGITARGDTEPIRRYIAETSAVDFAARSHGNYDFVATVIAPRLRRSWP